MVERTPPPAGDMAYVWQAREFWENAQRAKEQHAYKEYSALLDEHFAYVRKIPEGVLSRAYEPEVVALVRQVYTGMTTAEWEEMPYSERLPYLRRALGLESAAAVPTPPVPAAPPDESAPVPAMPATDALSPGPLPVMLASWQEILVALGKHDNVEDREKFRRLNKTYCGPIVFQQGRQPIVEQAKLLEWYRGLAEMVQAAQDRQRDAKATVSASYNYGENGEVVPDLSGSVKKRRHWKP